MSDEVEARQKALLEAIETFEARMEELAQEIEELEGSREALVPQLRETGVLCTGSMEPVITCLDTVVLLEDPRYEDIPIGAVVSFASPRGARILHTVVGVDIVDGVRWFQTKGHANFEPDQPLTGLHQRHIHGYVVEIKKDTRPENAGLRDKVNGARTKWEERLETYQTLRKRYCGRGGLADNVCDTSDANFAALLEARRVAISALDGYRAAYLEALCAHGCRYV